jgi:3-oxoadipate enol-lactonase
LVCLLWQKRHSLGKRRIIMSLAHDDIGQGTPVVLLHAFPFSRRMWAPQRDALKDVCRLITPDLPGFGDSPLSPPNPTVETMADAVAALLDEKGIRDRVILGGLSMGGYVAFAFVRKYADRLRGLILADTRAEPDDDTAKANRDKLIEFASNNPASAVIEQMMPKMVSPQTLSSRPDIVEEVKRLAGAQQPAGIVAALRMLRARPDSRPTLSTIRVPTLIIVGRDDALTPPPLSESMAGQIAGARLVMIGAGHLSNLEQPAAFNDAVRGFLS